MNVYRNPLGAVAADFANQLGSSSRSGAFAYMLAVVLDSLPVVGHGYGLSLHAPARPTASMTHGLTIPGLALPIFNLDGTIEIRQQITVVLPFTTVPASGHFQLAAAIPPAPSLAGLQLPPKAPAFADLATLSGSVTNLLRLPIQ